MTLSWQEDIFVFYCFRLYLCHSNDIVKQLQTYKVENGSKWWKITVLNDINIPVFVGSVLDSFSCVFTPKREDKGRTFLWLLSEASCSWCMEENKNKALKTAHRVAFHYIFPSHLLMLFFLLFKMVFIFHICSKGIKSKHPPVKMTGFCDFKRNKTQLNNVGYFLPSVWNLNILKWFEKQSKNKNITVKTA